METLTLYQFELCPFCHKVKAALDLKGVPFRKVEVNPMTKKELPQLPADAPKKVPVLRHGDQIVFDSTRILQFLDETFPQTVPFQPSDEAARKKSDEIEQWVDDEFTFALPTVIYGTWGEAIKAAQVTARTSNFGFIQNVGVRAGGSIIMHQVSKRILKKRGKQDGHKWIAECLDKIESWLGEQPFMTGDSISMGDVALHGAMTCIEGFPAHAEIMKRPRVASWYRRMHDARNKHRAN